MQTIDRMVLATLTDRILTDDRVRQMLLMLKQDSSPADQRGLLILKPLTSELEKNRQATERLFDAVESGNLPNDATLADRAHKLKARREELLTQIAGIRREAEIPDTLISPKNVRAFCGALRKRLNDPASGFGKQYLRLLVKDVRITGKEIRMRGSYEALGHAIAKNDLGTPEGVPSFIPEWRAPSERIRTASEIPIEVVLMDRHRSNLHEDFRKGITPPQVRDDICRHRGGHWGQRVDGGKSRSLEQGSSQEEESTSPC